MFSYLEKPADDELFASWLDTMLELNGMETGPWKSCFLNTMVSVRSEHIYDHGS